MIKIIFGTYPYRFMKILYYLVPFSTFLIIWTPVFVHYYVPNVAITAQMIEHTRRSPDNSVLDELTGGVLISWGSKENLLVAAEGILLGKVDLPGFDSMKITIPFSEADLEKGLPLWKLRLASLIIPDVLLSAYEISGSRKYLTTATEIISSLAKYERSAWFPKGLLWNDHAISARIAVLIRFWRHYRNDSSYQPEVAKDVLLLAARSGALLAKEYLFTFSTNHGIFQNSALLQIYIAFPTLLNAEHYKNLALNRMGDQMSFYINDEGVILEHSAGYQRDGLEYLGRAFRYLTLMEVPIPEDWIRKYEKGKDFYAQLRLPDGFLPVYGDTSAYLKDNLGPLVMNIDNNGRSDVFYHQKNWIPKQSNNLYPVAGYSIWWDGLDVWPNEQLLSQTVVIWSYFPGHAHKHADEMSVLLYAGGQRWWSNMGYWPYGIKGRAEAVSWNGSNAPHLMGESNLSVRDTRLKFHGWSDSLAFIDLERRGPEKYVARRQVLHFKPNLWIVVDHTTGKIESRTETTWTTFPDVILNKGKFPDSFYLQNVDKDLLLEVFFLTSNNVLLNHYRGSVEPFTGWVQNKPADSMSFVQPANKSWAATIWSLKNAADPGSHFTGQPYMHNWQSPDRWEIVLPFKTGRIKIWREPNTVYLEENNNYNGIKKVELVKPPGESIKQYAKIRASYENAASNYQRFRDLLSYRWKITYYLVIIFILQELFFFVYEKRKWDYYIVLRVLSIVGWATVIGLWFVFIHLKGSIS